PHVWWYPPGAFGMDREPGGFRAFTDPRAGCAATVHEVAGRARAARAQWQVSLHRPTRIPAPCAQPQAHTRAGGVRGAGLEPAGRVRLVRERLPWLGLGPCP